LADAPIAGRNVGTWFRRYDDIGITRELEPPESLRQLVSSAGCILASNARRSIESARWLAAPRDVRIDPDLREAALPDSLGVSIRMPPGVWVVIARVIWWLDWCRSAETIEATRSRASQAADRLCALVVEHGTVVVVGHGMFNRFVATQLVKRGWRGPRLLPAAYWSAARFFQQRPRALAAEPRD
jgi:broad specificity phosphatase PhoE